MDYAEMRAIQNDNFNQLILLEDEHRELKCKWARLESGMEKDAVYEMLQELEYEISSYH